MRLNAPLQHQYKIVDGIFIDRIAVDASIYGKKYQNIYNHQIFYITIVPMNDINVKYYRINIFSCNNNLQHTLHYDKHDGSPESMMQIY